MEMHLTGIIKQSLETSVCRNKSAEAGLPGASGFKMAELLSAGGRCLGAHTFTLLSTSISALAFRERQAVGNAFFLEVLVLCNV